MQQAAFVALALLLAWAPLPLASKRAWALALLAMGLCLVLLVAVAAHAASGGFSKPTQWRSLGPHWPLAALVAYTGWVALQLLPMPAGLLALLAPGSQEAGTISVDPYSTRLHLLASCAYLSAFAAVLLLVRTPKLLQALLLVLVVSGAFQAGLAIVLLGMDKSYTFLGTDFPAGDRAMGTFANTDHLANYLLMCLGLGVGLLLGSWKTGGPVYRYWQQRMVAALQFLMSPKMLLRLLLVAMVLALVLTRSRAGNGAFLLALLVTAALCAWRSQQLRRPALWLAASMLVVDVLVMGQWVGLDRVVQRMQGTALTQAQAEASLAEAAVTGRPPPRREESVEERLLAARDALSMVAHRPVAGFGGGSFYTVFPAYKGEQTLGYMFDHAHNDYVEVAATTGLVGLGLLLVVAVTGLIKGVSQMSDRQPTLTRGVAAGLVMATLSMALHSVVDFPLQMPANALTITVVLALMWCLPGQGGRSGAEGRSGRSRSSGRHSAAGAKGVEAPLAGNAGEA